jgi:hypothetical protein
VGERGERVVYLDGHGVGASISLREAQTPGAYDRYAVGLHHLAFEASSRELVDERLAWAKENGLAIENEPQEWPYVPGYYAGFFHDPDGIKLEIVYVPERSEMSTTPPPDQPGSTMGTPGASSTGGTTRTSGTPWLGSMPDAARLPIPGNAEFALYLVSVIVAWLVCWLTDSLNANNWFTFFTVITAIYILSRGIAKASRVLEQ